MILVTGGTGFIGSALVKKLSEEGDKVRLLIRPSQVSPNIPKGIPVEVAVSSLNDERGLRAAMKNVETIFHLAGTERRGSLADLNGVDIAGTETLSKVAREAGIKRLVYLSHLGADRASGFSLMKAKAIAEATIIGSGVGYTIIRSAAVFGRGDQFTEPFIQLARLEPLLFLLPGDGSALLQPLWIQDLIACLVLVIRDEKLENQRIQIGGMEQLSFKQVLKSIFSYKKMFRIFVPFSPVYLRWLTLNLEQIANFFPVSIFWLDYLASNHTCPLDNITRLFGIIPARFSQTLDYLHH
jgi:NADH dehydrogenase